MTDTLPQTISPATPAAASPHPTSATMPSPTTDDVCAVLAGDAVAAERRKTFQKLMAASGAFAHDAFTPAFMFGLVFRIQADLRDPASHQRVCAYGRAETERKMAAKNRASGSP